MSDVLEPHQLAIMHARNDRRSIYFLRSPEGTTYDVFTLELEARNARLKRNHPCSVYEQTTTGALIRLA